MKSKAYTCACWTVALAALWGALGFLWLKNSKWVVRADADLLPAAAGISPDTPAPESPLLLNPQEGNIDATHQDFDEFSRRLYQVGGDSNSACETVRCDVSALDRLYVERADFLFRYLASHPDWALRHDYKGRRIALRRMRGGTGWHDNSWNAVFAAKDASDFDDVIKVGCNVNFDREQDYGQICKSGDSVRVDMMSTEEDFTRGVVACRGAGLSMVVSELTTFPAARMIQFVFDSLQREFQSLAEAQTWDAAKSLLPADAALKEDANVFLREAILPGRYLYWARVNPGEPGETYLRVFEVSRGTELGTRTSGRRSVKGDTQESVGWSGDLSEKFFVGAEFFLHEYVKGGMPFAARVEVWFIPANGGPERKLVERVFKVKGGGR